MIFVLVIYWAGSHNRIGLVFEGETILLIIGFVYL